MFFTSSLRGHFDRGNLSKERSSPWNAYRNNSVNTATALMNRVRGRTDAASASIITEGMESYLHAFLIKNLK
jgi:hypothetical protein